MRMKKVICAILMGGFLLFCSSLPGYADMRGLRSHPGFAGHSRVGAHPGFRAHPGFARHPGFHRHGHFHTRVFIGTPLFWDPFPYYARPPVIIQEGAPTYIQQGDQSRQPYYWYYCEQSKTYYPYVQECPGGWLTVVPPQPSPAQ